MPNDDSGYGPNHTAVQNYLNRLPGLTFAQWGRLREPARPRDLARRSVEALAGSNPALNKAWINAWVATQNAVRDSVGGGFDVWQPVMDTTLALVFADLISADQYDQLTAPIRDLGGLL